MTVIKATEFPADLKLEFINIIVREADIYTVKIANEIEI